MNASDSTVTTALKGLKVVELCTMHAGPYCGKVLADMGAEVIKVEPPPSGDPTRRLGPFPQDIPHQERSGAFFYLNTNKLGITLNVSSPTGQHILRQLLQQADVFIEDWPPGALDALNLGYEALSQTHPALVVTSITPFGQTGPYRDYKAYPLNTFHAGGEGYTLPGGMGWSLFSDRPPLQVAGSAGEHYAGLMAAFATLIALFGRTVTGRGQYVDVSKQETLMNLTKRTVEQYPNEGHIESRATAMFQVGGTFQCKDGFVLLLINTDGMWTGLVELLGNPEWALREEYANRTGRAADGKVINAKIAEWTMFHTKDEIYHQGQAHGIAVTPYLTPEEVYASPQLGYRGYFVDVDFPGVGAIAMATAAYSSSKTPWTLRRPAPILGKHNQEVLCQRLGYSREDVVRLRACGII